MEFIIQSNGFTAGEELENYVKAKLSKVGRHADNIIRADVVLYKGAEGDPNNCFCEARLEMPGNDPFVKKSAITFEVAIVDVADTLERIVQDNKDKIISKRQS